MKALRNEKSRAQSCDLLLGWVSSPTLVRIELCPYSTSARSVQSVIEDKKLQQWKELVTFGLALLGSVLGVINTWRTISRDRINLRVRFVHGFTINAPHLPNKLFGVEVTNLSSFPLTINEVGLFVHGSTDRLAFIPNITLDNKPLPRKLESREQAVIYVPAENLRREFSYKSVYATTACGITKKVQQKTLRNLKVR